MLTPDISSLAFEFKISRGNEEVLRCQIVEDLPDTHNNSRAI